MGKYHVAPWAMLAVTVATAPAYAQEAPATAAREAKPEAGTISGKPGAASPSYARCAPGNPIGGIIVKGATSPTQRTGEAEGDCPFTESAKNETRTYTGGRRNEVAPSPLAEAGTETPAASGEMPSRLSMTPTTAKKAVQPAQPGKSINEKGVK